MFSRAGARIAPSSAFVIATGFLALYLLLDWISYIHPLQQSSITPWNPHPALAIALLALFGQRYLPVVAIAILAGELVVRKAAAGWPALLLIPIVLACGYAAIAATLASAVSLAGGLAWFPRGKGALADARHEAGILEREESGRGGSSVPME